MNSKLTEIGVKWMSSVNLKGNRWAITIKNESDLLILNEYFNVIHYNFEGKFNIVHLEWCEKLFNRVINLKKIGI